VENSSETLTQPLCHDAHNHPERMIERKPGLPNKMNKTRLEAEIGRIVVPSQPGQKKMTTDKSKASPFCSTNTHTQFN
jgi:hypothetical protein